MTGAERSLGHGGRAAPDERSRASGIVLLLTGKQRSKVAVPARV